MKIWIARDDKTSHNYYVLSRTKLRNIAAEGNIDWFPVTVCASVWHKCGGIHLKPGEGPVRIELSIKWKKVSEVGHT